MHRKNSNLRHKNKNNNNKTKQHKQTNKQTNKQNKNLHRWFLSLKHSMPRSFLSQNMSVNVLMFRGVVTMLTCTIYMGRKCFKPREANIRPGRHAVSHRVTKTALNCSFKGHLASRFHFRSNCMSLVHSASGFRGSACTQS